jgi:molybdate transport system substrate-binding protein
MKIRIIVAALGVAVVAAACGPSDDEIVLVSAAASLTDVFTSLAEAFEEDNPTVDVVLNVAGSSSLREQILAGAPVDVFASASASTMVELVEAGLAVEPLVVFATTQMRIATPIGNPAGVTGLDDFADDALLVGLCAQGVPCGDRAREVLASAGVTPSIDTNEPNVRALLTKIEEGELDAGITYVTDVVAADGRVEGVSIPDAHNVVASYPIAVVTDAPNPSDADAFVRFVLSEAGRGILSSFGFALP